MKCAMIIVGEWWASEEMSNPTRDGRAMIAAGLIHPDTPTTGPVSPAPNVTIGAIRVSNRPGVRQAAHKTRPANERGLLNCGLLV
jgi:hypothetical protein